VEVCSTDRNHFVPKKMISVAQRSPKLSVVQQNYTSQSAKHRNTAGPFRTPPHQVTMLLCRCGPG